MSYIPKDLLTAKSGDKITCAIDGLLIEDAEVEVEEGEVFICQNFKNGKDAEHLRGYRYSWTVRSGSSENLSAHDVCILSDLSLTAEKAGFQESVLKYVNKHLDTTLEFEGWEFNSEFRDLSEFEDLQLNETDKVVITVLHLSKIYPSKSSLGVETSKGRYRSSLDIWRHTKQFIPDADIFSVMRSLYKICYHKICWGASYCNDVKRIVFSRNGLEINQQLFRVDEYGGMLILWKDVGLEN